MISSPSGLPNKILGAFLFSLFVRLNIPDFIVLKIFDEDRVFSTLLSLPPS